MVDYKKEMEWVVYSYSSAASPIVPLVASTNISPNVTPLSLLILITGVSEVWFDSHHVTTTLSASESISTLVEV